MALIQPRQMDLTPEDPPDHATREMPGVGERVEVEVSVVGNRGHLVRTKVVCRVERQRDAGMLDLKIERWTVHESLVKRLHVVDQLGMVADEASD